MKRKVSEIIPPSRSEKAFAEALCELMKDHSFDEITISSLVTQSGYSRSAFYSRFEDKYDFVRKLVNRLAFCLYAYMSDFVYLVSEQADKKEIHDNTFALYEYIRKNHRYFDLILDERLPDYGPDQFAGILQKISEENEEKTNHVSSSKYDPAFFTYISIQDMISFIKYWKLNGYSFSSEFMSYHALLFIRRPFFTESFSRSISELLDEHNSKDYLTIR